MTPWIRPADLADAWDQYAAVVHAEYDNAISNDGPTDVVVDLIAQYLLASIRADTEGTTHP